MASQYQHRAWTVFLYLPINAERGRRQAASAIFQDTGMTRPGIELGLLGQIPLRVPNQLCDLASSNVIL